jgi:uncharacterized protein (TIGR03435 family)
MRWVVVASGLFVVAADFASGQTSERNLSFEVASVKQSGPGSVRNFEGGPGTKDPERFTATCAVLRDLLYRAYRVRGDDYLEQLSGPGWIDTEKYDVVVKIPPGTTRAQFQRMLQNLLAERFGLVVHHETKVLPIYELVVAKNGPKLKEAAEPPAGQPVQSPGGRLPVDRDGFLILPAGQPNLAWRFGPGRLAHWTAKGQSMEAFAVALNQGLAAGRRVIDKTGLTGKYDFTLYYEFPIPGAPPSEDPAPDLDQALQQQLGLRLVEGKAPFDVVVVDHADRVPTEN